MTTRNYLVEVVIGLDQLCNAILAGYADETLSSRAYRSQDSAKRWKIARIIIDRLFWFEPQHCKQAYESILAKNHLPDSFSNPTVAKQSQ